MSKMNSLVVNSDRVKLNQISPLKVRLNGILKDFKLSVDIKNGLFKLAGREWPNKLNGHEELQVIEYKSVLLEGMIFFNVSLIDESQIPVDGPAIVHIANTFVRYKKELHSLSSRNESQERSDGISVLLTNYALAKKGDRHENYSQMFQLLPLLIQGLKKHDNKRAALEEIFTLCFYFSEYDLNGDYAKLTWIPDLATLESTKDLGLHQPGIKKLESKLKKGHYPEYVLGPEKYQLSGLVRVGDTVNFVDLNIINEKLRCETTLIAKGPTR